MPASLPVTVERPSDAAAFLAEAGPFLSEHEAEHNLQFGIAASLRLDPKRHPTEPYFAVLRDGARVVGAAIMTPPFGIVLSRMDGPGSIPALAEDLAASGAPVSGVSARPDLAHAFRDAWVLRHAVVASQTRSLRIHQSTSVRMPTGTPGHGRIATVDDRDILVAYVDAFLQEAMEGRSALEAAAMVDGAFASGTRTFFLWDDGSPRSLAAVGGETPNGIRLGPVYTRPDHRGRGFGSSITAFATQTQFDAGRRFVFLFTDVANLTANKIYRDIGYTPVAEVEEWRFEPTA